MNAVNEIRTRAGEGIWDGRVARSDSMIGEELSKQALLRQGGPQYLTYLAEVGNIIGWSCLKLRKKWSNLSIPKRHSFCFSWVQFRGCCLVLCAQVASHWKVMAGLHWCWGSGLYHWRELRGFRNESMWIPQLCMSHSQPSTQLFIVHYKQRKAV